MKVKVKTFSYIEEKLGFNEKEITIHDSASVRDLLEHLGLNTSKIEDILLALNEEYCTIDRVLKDGDILAIFPPTSGG